MILYELKLFLAHATGISMDALHILVGAAIQIAATAVLRTSLASWRPWLLVLGLELLNEALDLRVERWPHPGMQLGESIKDVFLTLALPTLLMVIARRRPALLGAARPAE